MTWSDCVEPVSSSRDWSSNFTRHCHLLVASFDSKKLDGINHSDLAGSLMWSPRSSAVFFFSPQSHRHDILQVGERESLETHQSIQDEIMLLLTCVSSVMK